MLQRPTATAALVATQLSPRELPYASTHSVQPDLDVISVQRTLNLHRPQDSPLTSSMTRVADSSGVSSSSEELSDASPMAV
jgi:hypothetical protein